MADNFSAWPLMAENSVVPQGNPVIEGVRDAFKFTREKRPEAAAPVKQRPVEDPDLPGYGVDENGNYGPLSPEVLKQIRSKPQPKS